MARQVVASMAARAAVIGNCMLDVRVVVSSEVGLLGRGCDEEIEKRGLDDGPFIAFRELRLTLNIGGAC